MFDTIISGGEILDGTGKAGFPGDVGIKDGKVDVIDALDDAQSHDRIDAKGLVVAPGFIDIHTHSDYTLLVDGTADSQVRQGVTLEVIGQCGFSVAPLADKRMARSLLPENLTGLDIDWQSFGEYLTRLEERELGVNVMALVGHGTIRKTVMGDAWRQATPAEIAQMTGHLEAALAEGAHGFSTGLETWPGKAAAPEELKALCDVAASGDKLYATHVRNRDAYYDLGFSEALALARTSGVRLQISHIQPKYGAPPHAMANTLEMIRWARNAGADVAFDVIPSVWSHTDLAASLPPWALDGGISKLLKRLADREQREKMKHNTSPVWMLVPAREWDRIVLLRSNQHPELVGKTFTEIGEERKTDPYDAFFDLLLEAGEDLHSLMWTSHNFSEDDVRMCLEQPECMVISDTMALSLHGPLKDTIASVNGYGWAARFLQHYVREERVLPLADAVHRITGLPAARLGLSDRGVLRTGARADITVFDAGSVVDRSSVTDPCVHPAGIAHVLVNGQVVMRDHRRLPVNAGCVLR